MVLLTLVGLTSPVHAQQQPAEPQIDQRIEVEIASFRYRPDTLRIPSGETVKLVFHNQGNFDHEFMAGRMVTDDSTGYQTDLFEGIEVQKSRSAPEGTERERPGTRLTIKPDSTQSLTFRLPPSKRGEWEMGCFLTNPALHYKAGMKGTVLVQ